MGRRAEVKSPEVTPKVTKPHEDASVKRPLCSRVFFAIKMRNHHEDAYKSSAKKCAQINYRSRKAAWDADEAMLCQSDSCSRPKRINHQQTQSVGAYQRLGIVAAKMRNTDGNRRKSSAKHVPKPVAPGRKISWDANEGMT